jgi:hypothetical protein
MALISPKVMSDSKEDPPATVHCTPLNEEYSKAFTLTSDPRSLHIPNA